MTQDKIIESLIKETSTRLKLKQKQLSFDNYPVENSNNLVTSDGVKKYIDDKPDGGSEVVANPPMQGDEETLTGLQVDQDKYKIPTTIVQGSAASVDAPEIKTIRIQDTTYAVPRVNAYKSVKTNDVSPHFKSFTDKWVLKTWSSLTNLDGRYIWTDGENIYYSNDSYQYMLDKSTSTWTSKRWSGKTSFNGSSIWTDGENIYYSNGSEQYILDKATSTWTSKTWSGLTNFSSINIWTDGENIYYSYQSNQYVLNKASSTWLRKTWNGLSSFDGSGVWTDGQNIYRSAGSSQYVLDKSTSTWNPKTWNGLTDFSGGRIWTDGKSIYYSYESTQYVLDKETSTWVPKTWSGWTSPTGQYIWTDGENIYYSNDSVQYVLNKNTLSSVNPVLKKGDIISFNSQEGNTTEILQNIYVEGQVYNIDYPNVSTTPPDRSSVRLLDKITSTWLRKTWNGLSSFDGSGVWTDGQNIYRSAGSSQYVLDKSTSTWNPKTWNGLTDFSGGRIWTDGKSIYYSYESTQYVLDKSTSTWNPKTWNGLTNFDGQQIWTDGENIYYSLSNQYVLNKATSTWSRKTWSGSTTPYYGSFVWTDGENIYYSYDSNQYILDKASLTWAQKTWNGLTSFRGNETWTDGENIYYSHDYLTQYVLDKATSTWLRKTWNGLSSFSGTDIWTDGENIYCSDGSPQYVLNKNTILSTKERIRTGEIDFNTADDISKLDQIYGLRINGVEYKAIYSDLQVNNLTESNGIISWDAPDVSKYTNYQPNLSYSIYIDNVKISDTSNTSYDASAVFVSGNTYTIEVKANLSLQNSIDSSIEITN